MTWAPLFDLLGRLEPAALLLIGIAFGYWAELRRDEHQRTRDREQRTRDRQLDAISELQVSLMEALHGSWTANRAWELALLSDPTKVSAVYETDWHRAWLSAMRRVAIMVTRVKDPDLQKLVLEFNTIVAEMETMEDPKELDQAFRNLEAKCEQALVLAGKLYQEVDTV